MNDRSLAQLPEADDDTFAARVLDRDGLVIADFHTDNCVSCARLEPMLAAVCRDSDGTVATVKVNAIEAPATAARFGVTGVPTLLLIRSGTVVDRRVGFMTARDLRRWIAEHAEAAADERAGATA